LLSSENIISAKAGIQTKNHISGTPACQTVSQLANLQMLLVCHSGLDPESSAASGSYVSGCRICHPGLDPGPAWQAWIKRLFELRHSAAR